MPPSVPCTYMFIAVIMRLCIISHLGLVDWDEEGIRSCVWIVVPRTQSNVRLFRATVPRMPDLLQAANLNLEILCKIAACWCDTAMEWPLGYRPEPTGCRQEMKGGGIFGEPPTQATLR